MYTFYRAVPVARWKYACGQGVALPDIRLSNAYAGATLGVTANGEYIFNRYNYFMILQKKMFFEHFFHPGFNTETQSQENWKKGLKITECYQAKQTTGQPAIFASAPVKRLGNDSAYEKFLMHNCNQDRMRGKISIYLRMLFIVADLQHAAFSRCFSPTSP